MIITIPIPQATPNIQIHPLPSQNNIHVSKVHCGSAFEPGASGLPYYCTPPITVPAVNGARAVWWQNTKKTHTSCSYQKYSILCAPTRPSCAFLIHVFIRIDSNHLKGAHLWMFTSRLFKTHERNTCKQMNAKYNIYLCLHTYTMNINHYKW